MSRHALPDPEELAAGVRSGSRTALGRAITLVESNRAEDRDAADALVAALMPASGQAVRIGITGAPGVGKSTLIDAWGTYLTGRGHDVAVLAVDPSSARSGGSILGDKTRMAKLARDPKAFIRPSPSQGALGGVARRTRESMIVCEAAGFDVVLVETVGVGQSEVLVADMVDFFLVLVLAGGGDELQGIKRGILELADLVSVTKADGENLQRARLAKNEYAQALRLLPPRTDAWTPRVTVCSALDGTGLPELWGAVQEHREALVRSGDWERNRADQRRRWMWQALEDGLREALHRDPRIGQGLRELQAKVEEGTLSPDRAAGELLKKLLG